MASSPLPPSSTTTTPFKFPTHHSFPPFFTPQPTSLTQTSRLHRWSILIQSYCSHHHIYTLAINPNTLASPLFTNAKLNKRISLADAKDIIAFMCSAEGGHRAEWVDSVAKTEAWIWWHTPEEWGNLIAGWVDETGQKGVVLTLYEIVEGEGSAGQEFHGLDARVLQRSLQTLVKKGRAQVFGAEGGEGVKIF